MPPPIVTIGRRIIEDLDRRFDALDTDEDDEIELQELFKLYETDHLQAESILRFYDAAGDNVIDRDEFRKVGLLLLSNQKFRVADTDDSGALDRGEFVAAMKEMGFSKKFALEIFRRSDGDKSGEIDQMEFINAMLMFIADYDDIYEVTHDGADDDDDDPTPPGPTPEPTPPPTQTLGSKIIEILSTQFDAVDSDGNGFLMADELAQLAGSENVEIKKVLEYLDLDGNETISRQEFVNVGLLLQVKEFFQKYDENKNEALSKPELAKLLKDLGYTDGEIEGVFRRADLDGDGNVEEMEFYQAMLLTFSPPKNSSQIKIFLNNEIDEEDQEISFPEDVFVTRDTSLLNLHFTILREEISENTTTKRRYNAIFPTRLQGHLKDDDEIDDEDPDDTEVRYEMDVNFYGDDVNNIVDLKFPTAISMGTASAVQFTAIIKSFFDRQTPGGAVVKSDKEIPVPIKIQTLKSAQETQLRLTATKIATLGKDI